MVPALIAPSYNSAPKCVIHLLPRYVEKQRLKITPMLLVHSITRHLVSSRFLLQVGAGLQISSRVKYGHGGVEERQHIRKMAGHMC
jgi:hypothetical protein